MKNISQLIRVISKHDEREVKVFLNLTFIRSEQ